MMFQNVKFRYNTMGSIIQNANDLIFSFKNFENVYGFLSFLYSKYNYFIRYEPFHMRYSGSNRFADRLVIGDLSDVKKEFFYIEYPERIYSDFKIFTIDSIIMNFSSALAASFYEQSGFCRMNFWSITPYNYFEYDSEPEFGLLSSLDIPCIISGNVITMNNIKLIPYNFDVISIERFSFSSVPYDVVITFSMQYNGDLL